MTKMRTTILEQFLLLFNALKDTANGDPERVKPFYAQHRQMREAAHHLLTFLLRGDFHRRVLHGPKKYHWQVPEGFSEAYQDFTERWEPALTAACQQYKTHRAIAALDAFLTKDGAENKEFSNDDDSRKPEPGDDDYEFSEEIGAPSYYHPLRGRKLPIDYDVEDSFDPLVHDGASAFNDMFICVQGYAEDESGFNNAANVRARVGLEAYDYLTETIGFDPDGVFGRWNEVPIIFMPAHVSNKHGVEKDSLHVLIDEAVKAYVFGVPAAAMAMCRAVLEMILKQHYGLDHKYEDERGRIREKSLGNLIILAEKKYKFVHDMQLRNYSDAANRVMHGYDRRRTLDDKDEGKIILNFIKTLKSLIEHAPDL